MATFLIAQTVASLSSVSRATSRSTATFLMVKPVASSHQFPRNQPFNGDISHGSNGSQLSSVSRGTTVNGDVSHGLNANQPIMGFPRNQPLNGDISHGSNRSHLATESFSRRVYYQMGTAFNFSKARGKT